MSNLYGSIIGYNNEIKQITMESLQYRNMLIPAIELEADDILLMSMIHLGKVQLQNTEKNFVSVVVDGLEERAFPPENEPNRNPLGWSGRFSEIPAALVVRIRTANS